MVGKMFWFLIFALPSCYISTSYDFTGKIALVTGGSKGIGYETISEMLSNGVKGITMISRNVIKGRAAAKELNEKFGPGRVIFIPADISNSQQLEDVFKFSKYYWGGLDIVINNAGIADEVNWNFSVNVNVMGSLQGTFLGFKYMSVAKGGRGGVIINLSSVVGIDSAFTSPVYSAARTFTNSFGRALRHGLYHNYNEAKFGLLQPSVVAKGIVYVIKVAKSGSVWVSEDAFKFSNYYWNGLDILINNAATVNEVNWNFSVNVNVMGSLQGIFLGFKYMSAAKGGRGGVIINISSTGGIDPPLIIPVHNAAEAFKNSFGRALGHRLYYNYNKVRFITVCPAATFTDSLASYPNMTSESLAPNIRQLAVAFLSVSEAPQPASAVAKGIIHVIKVAKSGSVWVSESSELYEIDFPHRKSL